MTSKNNQTERLRKMSMEDKQDRFSIRKLAIGAASVLLGFSFVAASGQIAKADTIDSNGQETSTETSNQDKKIATSVKVSNNDKSKTDITTYSGLHSFLRSSERTEPTQGQSSNASSETENTSQKQDNGSGKMQTDSAEDLANAATDLQTEIGKGDDFVKTEPYKQATADQQQAVSIAITHGKEVLNKYNHFVNTNDETLKVSLFDLTDAKTTIGAMITAAIHTAGTQSLDNLTDYGDWKLQYSNITKILIINGGSSNNTNALDSTLYEFLSQSNVLGNEADNIQYIDINSDIKLKQDHIGDLPIIPPSTVPNHYGVFGNLQGLKEIRGLNHIKHDGSGGTMGFSYLFAEDPVLTTLDFNGFKTDDVESFDSMFADDTNLEKVDNISFNAQSVRTMSRMFYMNSSLKELDLRNFSTTINPSSSVIMSNMFDGDGNLKKITFGNQFVTSRVTKMDSMFNNDGALTEINGLNQFNTSGVTDMSNMFASTGANENLDLSNFNTSHVTTMAGMFQGSTVKKITLGNGFSNNPGLLDVSSMFAGADADYENLSSIVGLNNLDTSHVTTMANMFNGTTKLKELDLTPLKFTQNPTTTDMLTNAGDEDRFVLTLGHNVKLGTGSGLGSYVTGTGYRGYIRELGTGTISDPSGQVYLPNPDFSALQSIYSSGSAPANKTYVIFDQGPDNKTFIPSKLTLTVHTDQRKIDSLENKLNSLIFTESDPITSVPKQYTGAQLKGLDDLLLQSNKTITGVNWVPNKALSAGSNDDYAITEPSSSTGVVTDTAGTLNHSSITTSTPTPPEGLIKVDFGDGSSVYVRVQFKVQAATIKPSAQAFNSSTDVIALDKRFDTNSVPGSYISLTGVPETDGVYFTIRKYATSEKFKPLWDSSKVESGSTTGDNPAVLPADVIIHYADGAEETVGSVPIKINSMESCSPVGSLNRQTYPNAKNTSLLANMKVNAISQDKNITNVVWTDATGIPNPGPTLTEVGTQSAYVKVSYADGSCKLMPISIQVIAQPKPGIYDDVTHPGNIGVPQYTDIGNDQQVANNAAASASVPAGTTASWGDNTLPNTNSQGDKGYHFINVTYPDGSTASIPININVGNAVTKDITLKHNAYIYGADGKRANGITLKAGSTVTTYGTKLINGREFYLTKDADYYLAAGNDKPAERNLVQAANVYSKKGKKLKTVKHAGTTVKTYGAPILIKGKEYYSIGKNRYISKDSFPPTPDTTLPGLNKGSLSTTGSRMRLKKNTYLYDEKGQRANSLILKSGSIIQTHGSIQINGKTYYAVDTGEYINAKNVDENWLG
ncbi:SLAP domain-containing protein [Lactobacillus sp. ESL0791]|uniref:SLAP domain-containing protein n=1 Tax=Lactobacillus sp. ESL0791 TaxID=2983234 RepID=UPI0023F89E4F|nr:SLAP domain-containing protein [Lactobacillus sp. ESL0791]MDF7639621.1 SLAP domain-containing protein [Lactobacillus sp. ESL0791]